MNSFMLLSRYTEAVKNGVFANEIVPVDLGDKQGLFSKDEEPERHDWTSLASLPTIWGETIARGSSSKLADGAAACLMTNQAGVEK
jgi:acetyl-CoA acetyltransferase